MPFKNNISLLFNPENGIQAARKKPKRNVMRHLTTNLSGNSHLHNIYYNFLKRQYRPSLMYHNTDQDYVYIMCGNTDSFC